MQAQAAPPALFEPPITGRALHGADVEPIPILSEQGDGTFVQTGVFETPWLQNHNDRSYALMRNPTRTSIRLPRDRGLIVFCQVLQGIEHDGGIIGYVPTNFLMAVKKLRKARINERENPYQEIAAQRAPIGDDVHVIQMHDCVEDDHHLFLVMRDTNCTDLLDSYPLLHAAFQDGTLTRHQFIVRLMNDLNHLRLHRILHRDISPENILMQNGGEQFPLIDLAMSLRLEEGFDRVTPQEWCGKREYSAPESLIRDMDGNFVENLGHGIDMWAMGVIILFMLTGTRFWDRPEPVDTFYGVFILRQGLTNELTLDNILDFLANQPANDAFVTEMRDKINRLRQALGDEPELRSLLSHMLNPDPDERADPTRVAEHPWMAVGGH